MQRRHHLLRLRKRAGGGGCRQRSPSILWFGGSCSSKATSQFMDCQQEAIANLGGPVIHQLNGINIFG